MTDLNTKQQLFCIEYLKDFNATQAAIRAGYSKDTARQIGCENLTKLDIQKELGRQIQELLTQAKIPLEKQIFDYWIKRAFYNITDIIGSDGKMKMSDKKLEETGLHVCIDSINKKINAQGKVIIIYEFANKDKAVEMLQKYIQMIQEKVNITGNLTVDDVTSLTPEERRKRIADFIDKAKQ